MNCHLTLRLTDYKAPNHDRWVTIEEDIGACHEKCTTDIERELILVRNFV